MILTEPQIKIVAATPNPEGVIAEAYGICTNREVPIENIQKWIAQDHLSPIEHASVTVHIICSRVVTHELVRHRLAAYSQRSQRYVNESEPSYFKPPEMNHVPQDVGFDAFPVDVFQDAMSKAWKSYRELIRLGIPKQIARYVLPNACLTEIIATWNLRETRHIITLRTSKRAQPEMQTLVKKMLVLMLDYAPNVFADLKGLLDAKV